MVTRDFFRRISKKFELHRRSKMYRRMDYLEAYSKDTDILVERDPHSAIGGRWEEMGRLQFDFLVDKGLKPHHRLLDIGCGTLRGGRLFISYLNAGNYSGIDISSKAVEYGRQLVEREGLSEKKPQLIVSKNKDLKFIGFDSVQFDYLLAQSVFTHLKPEHIEECFQNIGGIMHEYSLFFFTYNEALEFKQTWFKGFSYPLSYFQSLADQHKFVIENCSEEYKHPRGQRMMMISRREATSS